MMPGAFIVGAGQPFSHLFDPLNKREQPNIVLLDKDYSMEVYGDRIEVTQQEPLDAEPPFERVVD